MLFLLPVQQAMTLLLQLLFSLGCMLPFVFSAGTPTIWTTTNYFRAGQFSPVTGGASTYNGVFTYGTAMSAAPVRRVALGYLDLDFTLLGSSFYLSLENPVLTSTASAFSYKIITNLGTDIKSMRINYFAVDQTYPYPLTFGYLTQINTIPDTSPFALSIKMNFTNSTGMVLNPLHDNAMLIFQDTIDVVTNSVPKCFEVSYTISILNSSYYEALVTSNCPNMDLYSLAASRIIFDKTAIEAGGYYYFEYGEIISYNSNISALSVTLNLFQSNSFMMGMTSYHISGQSKLNFTSMLGPTCTATSAISYLKLTFMYLSMKYRTCPTSNPYFYQPADLCYDVCPDGTYANTVLMMCSPCYYTCQTCSSYPQCTFCNTSNFRYQNGTSCLPMSGYFDNSTATAVLCANVITNCSTCTSATSCSTCAVGSYLAGASTCTLCSVSIANCQTCSSSAMCTNCSVGYYVTASFGCSLCSSVILNCLQCSSSILCTLCSTGFTPNGSLCVPSCNDTNCISCPTSTAVCQSCTTFYYVTNGTCTYNATCIDVNCVTCSVPSICDTCTSGYYVNGTSCTFNTTCTDANCAVCAVPSVCNNCSTGYYVTNGSCTFNTTCTDANCLACAVPTVCDSCAIGYYVNGTSCTFNTTCTDANCAVCAVPSVCNNCSTGYYVTNGSCTFNTTCTDANCLACAVPTVCDSCATGFAPTSGSCVPCADLNCLNCPTSASNCTGCATGFIANGSACSVLPCLDTNCLSCSVSVSVCEVCSPCLTPVSGICLQVCGNNFKTSSEQCDDGNTQSRDGCSMLCEIQTDFTCEPDALNINRSACFFTGQVTINTVYINKIDGQNKLEIKLKMEPLDLQAWNNVDFKSMIKLSEPADITNFIVNRNADGTITLEVAYAGNIQNKDLVVEVDPALSGLAELSRAPKATSKFSIVPNDNELAYYYDDASFKLANMIGNIATAVACVGLFLFIIGLVCAKVVGVQMMAVLQISFFGLAALSQLNPCFAALSNLWISSGYNKMSSLSQNSFLEDTTAPNQLKGIRLFSQCVINFNISLILILTPLLISLVCFVLSKALNDEGKKKTCYNLFHRFALEITFTMLMFSSYLLFVCFSIQIIYGTASISSVMTKVSLAECFILAGFAVVYLINMLYRPSQFGQFYTKFKKTAIFSRVYALLLCQRCLIGFVIVATVKSKYSLISVLALSAIFAMLTIILRPYAKTSHNVRFVCNMTITAVVMGIYIFYNISSTDEKGTTKIFMYFPLIICLLLLVCVVYNGVFIVHSLYKCIRDKKWRKLSQDSHEDQLESEIKVKDLSLLLENSMRVGRKMSLIPTQEQTSPMNLRENNLQISKIKQQIRSMGLKCKSSMSPTNKAMELKFNEMPEIIQEQI